MGDEIDMSNVIWQAVNTTISRKNQQMVDLLFFCPEKVAIIGVSGIITTNLGKTATRTKVTGRKKTDTSLQNMLFSLTGGEHFFWLRDFQCLRYKYYYNQ